MLIMNNQTDYINIIYFTSIDISLCADSWMILWGSLWVATKAEEKSNLVMVFKERIYSLQSA